MPTELTRKKVWESYVHVAACQRYYMYLNRRYERLDLGASFFIMAVGAAATAGMFEVFPYGQQVAKFLGVIVAVAGVWCAIYRPGRKSAYAAFAQRRLNELSTKWQDFWLRIDGTEEAAALRRIAQLESEGRLATGDVDNGEFFVDRLFRRSWEEACQIFAEA